MSFCKSLLRTLKFAFVAGLVSVGGAKAGDFSTSSVTYETPDFTLAGGSISANASDSAFFRFPLQAGVTYTFDFTRTASSNNYGAKVYDFVAAEGAGDPFPRSGASVLAETSGFQPTGSLTFTSLIDGLGTLEVTDFFSGAVTIDVDLVTDAVAAVPAPPAALMLASGMIGLFYLRRRRKLVEV
ncbi:MAG: hypothetical protein AAF360_11305 [Pseudomonadota bacterium]